MTDHHHHPTHANRLLRRNFALLLAVCCAHLDLLRVVDCYYVSKQGGANAKWHVEGDSRDYYKRANGQSAGQGAASGSGSGSGSGGKAPRDFGAMPDAKRRRIQQGLERRQTAIGQMAEQFVAGARQGEVRRPAVEKDLLQGLRDGIAKNKPISLDINFGDETLGADLGILPATMAKTQRTEGVPLKLDGAAGANAMLLVLRPESPPASAPASASSAPSADPNAVQLPSNEDLPSGKIVTMAVEAARPGKVVVFQPRDCEYDAATGQFTADQIAVPDDAATLVIERAGVQEVELINGLKFNPQKPLLFLEDATTPVFLLTTIYRPYGWTSKYLRDNHDVPQEVKEQEAYQTSRGLVGDLFYATVSYAGTRTYFRVMEETQIREVLPRMFLTEEIFKTVPAQLFFNERENDRLVFALAYTDREGYNFFNQQTRRPNYYMTVPFKWEDDRRKGREFETHFY